MKNGRSDIKRDLVIKKFLNKEREGIKIDEKRNN